MRRIFVRSVMVAVLLMTSPLVGLEPATAGWDSSGSGWRGEGEVWIAKKGRVSLGSSGQCSERCDWTVKVLCDTRSPEPCPFEVCRLGTIEYGLYLDGNLMQVMCLEPDERPVSKPEILDRVKESVEQLAPELTLKHQPKTRTLTQLPTIFRTGQIRLISRSDSLAGVTFTFRAQAQWRWTWGDGSVTITDDPGSSWPEMAVTHTYRKAGTNQVSVRTTWRATFWIEGDGPFDVPDDYTQSDETELRVAQARAVLVN